DGGGGRAGPERTRGGPVYVCHYTAVDDPAVVQLQYYGRSRRHAGDGAQPDPADGSGDDDDAVGGRRRAVVAASGQRGAAGGDDLWLRVALVALLPRGHAAV